MLFVAKKLAFIGMAALPSCRKEFAAAIEVEVHGRILPEDRIDVEVDQLGRARKQHAKLTRRERSILMEETRLSPVAEMILDMNSKMTKLKPPPGACQNIRVNAEQTAEANCEEPMKATGCSCTTASTPGCGTQFSTGEERCVAMTKKKLNVTAVARCCHVDWAYGWEAVDGELSDAGQSDSVATCPNDKTAVGCACHPVVTGEQCQSYGVNLTNYQQCLATGHKDNTAGVKAIAKCASFADTPDDYFVSVEERASEFPVATNGAKAPIQLTEAVCANTAHQMISCHCSDLVPPPPYGNQVHDCYGGSIIAQKCQCWGEACVANAKCGNVPPPVQDCQWADWSDWGVCSVSCGNGTMSRERGLATPAYHGGKMCTGDIEENQSCDDTVDIACAPPHEEEKQGFLLYIIIGIVVVAVLAAGGGIAFYMQSQSKGKGASAAAAEGEGEYGADYGEEGEGEYVS